MNNSTTARPLVGNLTGGTPNPWDFVPDGKCDGKDIAIVAMWYGSAAGCPPPYIWNAHCDVNNDSKVDGEDIAVVAIHFGEANFSQPSFLLHTVFAKTLTLPKNPFASTHFLGCTSQTA